MSVLAELEELVALSASTPCTLDAPCALFSSPHKGTPCPLDSHGHVVPVSIAHGLECKERLGVLDEALRDTELPFVTRNACIKEDALTAAARIALPDIVTCIRCRS